MQDCIASSQPDDDGCCLCVHSRPHADCRHVQWLRWHVMTHQCIQVSTDSSNKCRSRGTCIHKLCGPLSNLSYASISMIPCCWAICKTRAPHLLTRPGALLSLRQLRSMARRLLLEAVRHVRAKVMGSEDGVRHFPGLRLPVLALRLLARKLLRQPADARLVTTRCSGREPILAHISSKK